MRGRDHGAGPLPIASDTADAPEFTGGACEGVSARLYVQSDPGFPEALYNAGLERRQYSYIAQTSLGLWENPLPQALQCRGLQARTITLSGRGIFTYMKPSLSRA